MNRRDILTTTATGAFAVMLFPARLFAQDAAKRRPEMGTLCAYMSGARTRPLPADVAEQAKHHLLDTLAAMVSGSQLPPGQAGQHYVGAQGGKGSATIVASALTAAPADAALANGMMAHSDETDDSHNPSRSHPGCATVPAALAAGEVLGIDGTHLLHAVTLGYDVGTRIVMAMGGAAFSYRSSIATHSVASTFCATAAAACAAGLDARQMHWALDYAAQQSSGIVAWRRDSDHIEKSFVFAGMTARNGVTAALGVRSGWNGVDDVFSGDDNFFAAYAPEAKPELIVEALGERYEIARTDIKKWTVGSPIQGPLDALAAILDKHPVAAEQVRQVRVRLAPSVAAVVNNREMPDICLQHMIAVMLLDKTASFRAAHDKPRMQDPAVLRQRAKVTLIGDEELAKLLPVRVAEVEVELEDGTRLSERVSAVRGTPRNPMSRAEVIGKAHDLIDPVLGGTNADKLIETVYAIETVGNVRDLGRLLRRG